MDRLADDFTNLIVITITSNLIDHTDQIDIFLLSPYVIAGESESNYKIDYTIGLKKYFRATGWNIFM